MYADKGQSLLEKKKLQWAREKEELAGLNLPWGSKDPQFVRTRNAIKLQNSKETLRREASSRRRSLPPLSRNKNVPSLSNEKLEKEMGGETSGYGSDNVNGSPVHYQQVAWNHSLGYESSSSGKEDRPKWGDRGVHVGKFWEPKTVENDSKDGDTPGWVKRGLETDTKLIVSNSSPAESPEQEFGERERPCTGSTTSQLRSYIRGQNAPVDPYELEERERRRQMALAHQEAIRQQLEEREQRRKDEREKRLREEYEEEERIRREKEIERQRKEQEQKLMREKLERERKRKEVIHKALELAEAQAKQEKLRQREMVQNNLNIRENLAEKENNSTKRSEENNNNNFKENANIMDDLNKNCQENNDRIKKININNNTNKNLNASNGNNINNNKNVVSEANVINVNSSKEHGGYNIRVPPLQLNQANSQSDFALVLQTPYETFQNMQFAVLMPTIGTGAPAALPIAVPLTLATDRSNTSRTENRILTPTQYRNRKFCDSSTQTDAADKEERPEGGKEKFVREKFSNPEHSYENRNRKERIRIRLEDRMNEERPKWGVNRPPTRYVKQSEKDPLYQRRKQRQKLKQVKDYDEKNINYSPHSSDDSQMASPRMYRKNVYPEKRHGRALWQKNEQLFAQNVRVYQTEIIPLESDKDQIYYKSRQQCCCHCQERQKCSGDSKRVDILKIDHGTPRGAKHLLPLCVNNSLESSSEILNSTNNEAPPTQEALWENSPRSLSLCSRRRNSEC